MYTMLINGGQVQGTEKSLAWNGLYNALRDNGQKGSCIQALSAVEMLFGI